jgi:hypothetical protein
MVCDSRSLIKIRTRRDSLGNRVTPEGLFLEIEREAFFCYLSEFNKLARILPVPISALPCYAP